MAACGVPCFELSIIWYRSTDFVALYRLLPHQKSSSLIRHVPEFRYVFYVFRYVFFLLLTLEIVVFSTCVKLAGVKGKLSHFEFLQCKERSGLSRNIKRKNLRLCVHAVQ